MLSKPAMLPALAKFPMLKLAMFKLSVTKAMVTPMSEMMSTV